MKKRVLIWAVIAALMIGMMPAYTSQADAATNTHVVSFSSNGGTTQYQEITVRQGTTFWIPVDPSRSGYGFKCWYLKRLKDQKWYVSGKGWYTWDQIRNNGWSPRSYSYNQRCTIDASWTKGCAGSNYRFYAQWQQKKTTPAPTSTQTSSGQTTNAKNNAPFGGRKVVSISKVSFSFGNFGSKASKGLCRSVYKPASVNSFYKSRHNNGGSGNCFGMATCAGRYYSNSKINTSKLSKGTKIKYKVSGKTKTVTVKQGIKMMHIAYSSREHIQFLAKQTWHRSDGSINRFANAVITDLKKDHLTVVTMGNSGSAHSVTVIGFEAKASMDRFLIYDSYYGNRTPQSLYLYKNSNGSYNGKWAYYTSGKKRFSSSNVSPFLCWTTYSQYNYLWNNQGKLTYDARYLR